MTEETANEAAESIKEKVKSIGKKTEEKVKDLKDKSMETTGIGPTKDAHDIQALGTTRLEKLLEGQIDVIDSRLKMVNAFNNNKTESKTIQRRTCITFFYLLFSKH